MRKRVRVLYSGRVQGVGFRFTVERIAAELDLTGWVRNLQNGRVELLSEGEEKRLKLFLAKISEDMNHYIHEKNEEWDDATGEFNSFQIISL